MSDDSLSSVVVPAQRTLSPWKAVHLGYSFAAWHAAPPAVYDPVSNTTFVGLFQGNQQVVVAYRHTDELADGPVLVGVAEVGQDGKPWDFHNAPSMAIDGDGYIHIVWAEHNRGVHWGKSVTPHSVRDGFDVREVTEIADGTYTALCYDPVSERLWVTYRTGLQHDGAFPAHAWGELAYLPDGDDEWVGLGGPIDVSGSSSGVQADYYSPGLSAVDGKIWLTFQVSLGTTHDDCRQHAFAAYYDPATSKFFSPAGVDKGATLTWSELTQAGTSLWVRNAPGTGNGVGSDFNRTDNVQHHNVGLDAPLVTWVEKIDPDMVENDSVIKCARWDADAAEWVVTDMLDTLYTTWGIPRTMYRRDDGSLLALVTKHRTTSGTDIAWFEVHHLSSDDDGATWTDHGVVAGMGAITHDINIGPVVAQDVAGGGDHMAGLWMPQAFWAADELRPVYGLVYDA